MISRNASGKVLKQELRLQFPDPAAKAVNQAQCIHELYVDFTKGYLRDNDKRIKFNKIFFY